MLRQLHIIEFCVCGLIIKLEMKKIIQNIIIMETYKESLKICVHRISYLWWLDYTDILYIFNTG